MSRSRSWNNMSPRTYRVYACSLCRCKQRRSVLCPEIYAGITGLTFATLGVNFCASPGFGKIHMRCAHVSSCPIRAQPFLLNAYIETSPGGHRRHVTFILTRSLQTSNGLDSVLVYLRFICGWFKMRRLSNTLRISASILSEWHLR